MSGHLKTSLDSSSLAPKERTEDAETRTCVVKIPLRLEREAMERLVQCAIAVHKHTNQIIADMQAARTNEHPYTLAARDLATEERNVRNEIKEVLTAAYYAREIAAGKAQPKVPSKKKLAEFAIPAEHAGGLESIRDRREALQAQYREQLAGLDEVLEAVNAVRAVGRVGAKGGNKSRDVIRRYRELELELAAKNPIALATVLNRHAVNDASKVTRRAANKRPGIYVLAEQAVAASVARAAKTGSQIRFHKIDQRETLVLMPDDMYSAKNRRTVGYLGWTPIVKQPHEHKWGTHTIRLRFGGKEHIVRAKTERLGARNSQGGLKTADHHQMKLDQVILRTQLVLRQQSGTRMLNRWRVELQLTLNMPMTPRTGDERVGTDYGYFAHARDDTEGKRHLTHYTVCTLSDGTSVETPQGTVKASTGKRSRGSFVERMEYARAVQGTVDRMHMAMWRHHFGEIPTINSGRCAGKEYPAAWVAKQLRLRFNVHPRTLSNAREAEACNTLGQQEASARWKSGDRSWAVYWRHLWHLRRLVADVRGRAVRFRNDHYRKQARLLANRCADLRVDDVDLAALKRTGAATDNLQDAAPATLRAYHKEAVSATGGAVFKVKCRGTTKTCNACLHLVEVDPSNSRVVRCLNADCDLHGVEQNRDHNAAQVIRDRSGKRDATPPVTRKVPEPLAAE